MKITIRLLESRDLDEATAERIPRLLDQLFFGAYEVPMKWQWLEEAMSQDRAFPVGAFADGKLVGMMFCYVVRTFSRKMMREEDFVVDDACRGHGVGAKMDEFAVELAKRQGCDAIELIVNPDASVRRVHHRTGFTDKEVIHQRIIFTLWTRRGGA